MLQQKTKKQKYPHIKNERAKKSPKPNEELEKEQQLLCHQYFKNRYLTGFFYFLSVFIQSIFI